MEELLYEDFLKDDQVYEDAQNHWKTFFDDLLEEYDYSHQPYLNNTMVSGEKLRDGNPIFNAYIPEIDRAVRIIQEEPEEPEELTDITSWVNDTEWPNGRPLKELVICLVLTGETEAEARRKIREWVDKQPE